MMKPKDQKSSASCSGAFPSGKSCPAGYKSCSYKRDHPWGEFKKVWLGKGNFLPSTIRKAHRILFLVSGNLHIRLDGQHHYLGEKQCMFLVKDSKVRLEVTADAEIYLLDFTNRMIFCHNDVLTVMVLDGGSNDSDSPVMSIVPELLAFLRGLSTELLQAKMACYHVVKEHELCLLMWHVYGVTKLSVFFRSILHPKDDFELFVQSSYRKVETLAEIARMANLSESSFRRKFRETFNENYYGWRVKQISSDMIRTIRNGILAKEELMELFNFKTYQSFYRFCTRNMGHSPTELIEIWAPQNE